MTLQVAGVTGRSGEKPHGSDFVGSYSLIKRIGRLMIGTGLICTATAAGENYNYLVVVGPAPLRFQAPTPQYDPAKVLPPLKMQEAVATNIVETPPPTPAAQIVAESPLPEEQAAPPVQPENPPSGRAPTPELSEPGPDRNLDRNLDRNQMTPQMLLRYFSPDGSKEVIVPTGVEFTPPPPAPGNRSSAVYTSPPAN